MFESRWVRHLLLRGALASAMAVILRRRVDFPMIDLAQVVFYPEYFDLAHRFFEESWEEICNLVDTTSPYALTGAIFSQDEKVIASGRRILSQSAGNFYINDKPTGAVVGQQPFGGGRASGTNDKAGSSINLLRWTSQRTIKETYNPPEDYKYPFMKSK